ncbi:unnamed protein product [Urochloa humidicola]
MCRILDLQKTYSDTWRLFFPLSAQSLISEAEVAIGDASTTKKVANQVESLRTASERWEVELLKKGDVM